MRKIEWTIGLLYLAVLVVLPLIGHWARQGGERTCSYDGGKIEPLYHVRIVDDQGRDLEFCCIHCAESWLRGEKAKPLAVFVTDETSGDEIDAPAAHFVRSLVVTNATTNNRIHAFREELDAQAHARACLGQFLQGAERPFFDLQNAPPQCPHYEKSEAQKE